MRSNRSILHILIAVVAIFVLLTSIVYSEAAKPGAKPWPRPADDIDDLIDPAQNVTDPPSPTKTPKKTFKKKKKREKAKDTKSKNEPEIDPFVDEKPVKFDFDKSKMKKIKFKSCGYEYEFEAYEIKPGEILIPLSSKNTDLLLDKFHVTAKYDKDKREVIFTRGEKKKDDDKKDDDDEDTGEEEDVKQMRMKIDYAVMDYVGTKREIPVPPRIVKGMVHISPNSFAKFLWACFLYDDKREIYYLDPFVLDVKLETSKKGLTKVVARGTGPFKHRILKLREPTRFVIDVMNACLDGKARQINHPVLGAIRFSQNDLKGEEGNVVRIVVPQSEEFEIAMAKSRAENYVEAELRSRASLAPVQDLALQKIEKVKVFENEDLVTIIMTTSGPVQMEWNRLMSPDDRFFIDIPGAVYPDKKNTFKLENKFLPEVRIAQFQPKPDPKVRMVLPLEEARKVSIVTNSKEPDKIKIYVRREKIDPKTAIRKGFIVTYYPSKGLVICIDPGHGGSDPGAVNRGMGLMEKKLTLDISNRLKNLLRKEGWVVVMTRNSDRDVSYPGSPNYEELGARTQIGNDLRAHVFVSIHINAAYNKGVHGFSTYWYKSNDKDLARHVQQSMVSGVTCNNLGVRRERFFVLRTAKMPAVLVEAGFITNKYEAKRLSNPKYRQKVAESIMKGLRNYAHAKKLKAKK